MLLVDAPVSIIHWFVGIITITQACMNNIHLWIGYWMTQNLIYICSILTKRDLQMLYFFLILYQLLLYDPNRWSLQKFELL